MMTSPTQLTKLFEKKSCPHGFPLFVTCSRCEREAIVKQLPKDHPKCIHGQPDGYCEACENEKKEQEKREEKKERELRNKHLEEAKLWELQNQPEKWLQDYGVPRKYLDCSFESFERNSKLVSDCKKYKEGGLVLSGITGSGKTHLSVAILRGLIKKDSILEASFVTVPDLLMKIRASFNDRAKETEEEIVDFFSKCSFLILDDLGSEKTTEFAITTLYIIIDRRDREMLSTIITTNLTLQEIEEKLDARIASRMAAMKNIRINMKDYRKLRRDQ